jgi:hypothetical protein
MSEGQRQPPTPETVGDTTGSAPVPLSQADRAILALEGPTIACHTCKVIRLGSPAPSPAALTEAIAARLPLAPALTWRLAGPARGRVLAPRSHLRPARPHRPARLRHPPGRRRLGPGGRPAVPPAPGPRPPALADRPRRSARRRRHRARVEVSPRTGAPRTSWPDYRSPTRSSRSTRRCGGRSTRAWKSSPLTPPANSTGRVHEMHMRHIAPLRWAAALWPQVQRPFSWARTSGPPRRRAKASQTHWRQSASAAGCAPFALTDRRNSPAGR